MSHLNQSCIAVNHMFIDSSSYPELQLIYWNAKASSKILGVNSHPPLLQLDMNPIPWTVNTTL